MQLTMILDQLPLVYNFSKYGISYEQNLVVLNPDILMNWYKIFHDVIFKKDLQSQICFKAWPHRQVTQLTLILDQLALVYNCSKDGISYEQNLIVLHPDIVFQKRIFYHMKNQITFYNRNSFWLLSRNWNNRPFNV